MSHSTCPFCFGNLVKVCKRCGTRPAPAPETGPTASGGSRGDSRSADRSAECSTCRGPLIPHTTCVRCRVMEEPYGPERPGPTARSISRSPQSRRIPRLLGEERDLIRALHVVQKGETFAGIMRMYPRVACPHQREVLCWRCVYEHPINADLRELRPDPNKIHPGDIIAIPKDMP